MQLELLKISYKALYHSTVCLQDSIYVDPYKIEYATYNAKYIFITHPHFDHLSIEDINKIINKDTIFIATKDSIDILKKDFDNPMIEVNVNKEYIINDLKINVIPSYNKEKKFHPVDNNWVGYLIENQGISYYIIGDSDYNEYMNDIECDVLFVPIGGTYTMDYKEAAKLTNAINPKIVVPIHFNSIEGLEVDKEDFIELINSNIIIE